jgi:hypothetical protein
MWGFQYLSQQMFFCVLISWNLIWFKIPRKIQIYPLSGLSGQSGVHRTLHCAMSDAPAGRAWHCHCAAMSGGAPDCDCALSSVHRTSTVHCPVCPWHVFKKILPLPEPEARTLLYSRTCSLSLYLLHLAAAQVTAGHRHRQLAPASTPLARAWAPSSPLVRSPTSVPLSLSLCFLSSEPPVFQMSKFKWIQCEIVASMCDWVSQGIL